MPPVHSLAEYSIGLQCSAAIPELGMAAGDCVILRAHKPPSLVRELPDTLPPILAALTSGRLVSISGVTVGEILNTLAPEMEPPRRRRARFRFRPDGRADLRLAR